MGNGFLNTVSETLRKPSIEKLEKTFPHLNLQWLLIGEGEMLKSTHGSISNSFSGDNNSNVQMGGHGVNFSQVENQDLLKRIADLEKEIANLKETIALKDKIISLLESK